MEATACPRTEFEYGIRDFAMVGLIQRTRNDPADQNLHAFQKPFKLWMMPSEVRGVRQSEIWLRTCPCQRAVCTTSSAKTSSCQKLCPSSSPRIWQMIKRTADWRLAGQILSWWGMIQVSCSVWRVLGFCFWTGNKTKFNWVASKRDQSQPPLQGH